MGGIEEVGLAELFRNTALAKFGAVLGYVEHLLTLGTKFLLFGHHHSMLDALEREIMRRGVGMVRIDGRTPQAERPVSVARFQKDDTIRVALLSITAAGQGLTLTEAH